MFLFFQLTYEKLKEIVVGLERQPMHWTIWVQYEEVFKLIYSSSTANENARIHTA